MLFKLILIVSIINVKSQTSRIFCNICTCRGDYVICGRGLPSIRSIVNGVKTGNYNLIVRSDFALYLQYKSLIDQLFKSTKVQGYSTYKNDFKLPTTKAHTLSNRANQFDHHSPVIGEVSHNDVKWITTEHPYFVTFLEKLDNTQKSHTTQYSNPSTTTPVTLNLKQDSFWISQTKIMDLRKGATGDAPTQLATGDLAVTKSYLTLPRNQDGSVPSHSDFTARVKTDLKNVYPSIEQGEVKESTGVFDYTERLIGLGLGCIGVVVVELSAFAICQCIKRNRRGFYNMQNRRIFRGNVGTYRDTTIEMREI